MGKYDNYSNIQNIKKAEKKLTKLKNKRNPNVYQIELMEQQLNNEKLFETCQIFGREDFWKSEYNPNANVMFSDDNKVMKLYNHVIRYEDIKSYRFVANEVQKAHTQTTTRKKGTVGRALVGGALMGGVGVIAGAASAGEKSMANTTYYTSTEGFELQIFLKNSNQYYSCPISNVGVISAKIPKLWLELGTKLDKIIEENKLNEQDLDNNK